MSDGSRERPGAASTGPGGRATPPAAGPEHGTGTVAPHRRARRGARLTAGLVVLVALLLAACGSDDGGGDGGSSAAPDGTVAAPGPAGAPELGRVVVLAEEPLLADALALGVTPVASSATVPEEGFQGMGELDTSGIEVLSMTDLNLEQLAALRPDTIVSTRFLVDQVGADALAGLGELLVVPDGLPTEERLAELGELLGRSEQAAAVQEQYDAAVQQAATAVPDDCRVSLAAVYPGPSPAAFVAGPTELATSVLATGCELDPDASAAAPDRNGRAYLSLEQLGLLDAPTLVLLQSTTVEGEAAGLAELEANPLWGQLPAVRAGRVVTLDRLGYAGALGQIRFLGDLAEALG